MIIKPSLKILIWALLIALGAIAPAVADMKMGSEGGSLNLPGVSSDGNDGIEVDGQVKAGSAFMGSSRLTAIHVAALPATPTAGATYWVDDATSACVLGAGGGGVESEFKWDGSAWVGALCSTGTGLATTDIDTLAELNGILGDSNLYSTAQVDALLAKAALLGVLDLETTDSPSYAAMTLTGASGLSLGVAGTTMGLLKLYSNVAENTHYFGIIGGADFTEDVVLRAPPSMPTVANMLMNADVTTGNMGWTDPATFMLASNAGVAPGNYLTLQADPGQHTLYGFDNTTNTYHPIIIGTGLSYDQPSNTLTGSGSGYTNLTSFVAQTPWRVFYSNADGDVTELALGDAGTVLKSNGASAAPSFQADSTGAGGDQLVDIVATSPLLVNGGAALNDALPGSDADVTFSLPAATNAVAGYATAAHIQAIEANTAKVSYTPATPGEIGGTTPAVGRFTTVYAANYESSAADGSRISILPNNTSEPSRSAGESGFFTLNNALYYTENGGNEVAFSDLLLPSDVDTPAKLETVAGLGAFFSDFADDDNATEMQTTLGLVPGVNVLAYDADYGSLGSGISGLVWGLGDGNGYQAATRANFGAMDTVNSFTSPVTTNPYSLPAANCYGADIYYGATGEIDLPAGVDGMNIIIYNTGAFTITIDPNASQVIIRDGTAQTGGVSMTLSSGAGNYVCMIFDGTQWVTKGYKGTLAAGT